MHLLTKIERIEKLCEVISDEYIRNNICSEIYLFGSVLYKEQPDDIDILVVYKNRKFNFNEQLDNIVLALETIFELPVDVTVLSENEIKETSFLDKLCKNYQRVI